MGPARRAGIARTPHQVLHMRLLPRLLVAFGLVVLCAGTVQAQATVTCKDGSKSKGGQGACSGHGGIAPAGETKKEMKATKAEEKKEAKAEAKKEAKAEAKKETKADAKKETKAEKKETQAEKKEARAEKKAEKAADKAAAKDAKMSAKDDDKDPKGATAECKDHTYSHAKNYQGACSNHGGILKKLP